MTSKVQRSRPSRFEQRMKVYIGGTLVEAADHVGAIKRALQNGETTINFGTRSREGICINTKCNSQIRKIGELLIDDLQDVTEIAFWDVTIQKMFDWVERTNVKHLRLSFCKLEAWDGPIYSLETLYMASSKVYDLPQWLSECQNLTRVFAEATDVSVLYKCKALLYVRIIKENPGMHTGIIAATFRYPGTDPKTYSECAQIVKLICRYKEDLDVTYLENGTSNQIVCYCTDAELLDKHLHLFGLKAGSHDGPFNDGSVRVRFRFTIDESGLVGRKYMAGDRDRIDVGVGVGNTEVTVGNTRVTVGRGVAVQIAKQHINYF